MKVLYINNKKNLIYAKIFINNVIIIINYYIIKFINNLIKIIKNQ